MILVVYTVELEKSTAAYSTISYDTPLCKRLLHGTNNTLGGEKTLVHGCHTRGGGGGGCHSPAYLVISNALVERTVARFVGAPAVLVCAGRYSEGVGERVTSVGSNFRQSSNPRTTSVLHQPPYNQNLRFFHS